MLEQKYYLYEKDLTLKMNSDGFLWPSQRVRSSRVEGRSVSISLKNNLKKKLYYPVVKKSPLKKLITLDWMINQCNI